MNFSRAQRAIQVLTITIGLSAGLALPATAGVSWTVARRPDAKLISLARALDKKQADYPHLAQESAFILLKSRVWESDEGSHLIVRNEMIRVSDPKYKAASTRTLRLNSEAKLKYHAAWIQREGKIIRLDDQVWNIVKGDQEKATTVVIAFPDVQQGDILGWSLEENCDWFFSGGYIEMAEDLPVMMCRTRIKTDGTIAYKMTGEHLRRDLWSRKILEKKHGAACDVRLTVVDIPRHPTGRYAPTFLEFEPYIFVAHRGFWRDRANRWMFNVSWNEVAAQGSQLLDYIDDEAGKLNRDAHRIVLGYDTPRDQVAALHRYIRDEIVTVSPAMVRSRKRDPKSVFDSRQATPRDKSILLLTMCRSLGLDVDLLAGRNRLLSAVDKGNPNLWQLTDFVVRLNSDPVAYFTPFNDNCAPGSLPPGLRGAEVLAIPRGKEDRLQEVRRQAFDNTGAQMTLYWDEYCRLIRREKLTKWIILPGDPDEVMARTAELVRYLPGQSEVSIQIQAEGYSDLQFDLRRGGEDDQLLAGYVADRYDDWEVVSASFAPAATRGAQSQLSGRATVGPVPRPAGGHWIIPAENVFGKVFLHDWDLDDGMPFIDRIVEDFRYTWRTPLPDGWQAAMLPRGIEVSHPQFTYVCRFSVADGDLVVDRQVRLNRELTMYSDLPGLAEKVRKVQGFERSPVVISRN